MIHFILSCIFIISLFVAKSLYKKWINQIFIYSTVWFVMLSLYEFKLLHYVDLSSTTWIVIGGAYFSFILGSTTYFVARKNFVPKDLYSCNLGNGYVITDDKLKIMKMISLFTGLVGLIGAIQHWSVLLNYYGSFSKILISTPEIYKLRVSGELKGVIPYLSAFSFVSIFFSAMVSAFENKFSLYAVISIFAVILQELANISRAGMLFGIIEFVLVLILFNYFHKNQKAKKNTKLVVSLAFSFVLIIIAATLVRSAKGSIEHFKNSTRTLNKLNENMVITPSIYLYFSADVGVLNQYLIKDDETTQFGENTFMPIYRLLNKFDLVEKPKVYQKGYYIPMWVNTGTYLRELHADFGLIGIFFFPYVFGMLLSFFWNKLMSEFDYFYFVVLVYSFIILSFSFLVMISRLGNFLISFSLLILLAPLFSNSKKIV